MKLIYSLEIQKVVSLAQYFFLSFIEASLDIINFYCSPAIPHLALCILSRFFAQKQISSYGHNYYTQFMRLSAIYTIYCASFLIYFIPINASNIFTIGCLVHASLGLLFFIAVLSFHREIEESPSNINGITVISYKV
jgi:hypothetical protein